MFVRSLLSEEVVEEHLPTCKKSSNLLGLLELKSPRGWSTRAAQLRRIQRNWKKVAA